MQHQLVEEASPISSRPPAAGNLEDFMRMSSGGDEGGGGPSGNRWPRQETLALLKIRSDMDAVFRDATVKGPLWEDVSRKLAELGYKRSAKKCKEKFENVHKYYKRTKDGRAGRQAGKTYKFFTELEALQANPPPAPAPVSSAASPQIPPTSVTLDVAPVSVGIPMPVSSSRLPAQNPSTVMFGAAPQAPSGSQPPPAPPYFGVSFSSESYASESSQGSGNEDSVDEQEIEVGSGSRKRKRPSSTKSGGGSTRRMMEFFEGLMKRVMHKQELMQQRFLEAIEKREQERMVREESWKRQEMARLAREHELMAQERAIAASRDAAIVSFLQKITNQTIELPTAATVTVPAKPAPAPPPAQPPSLTITVPINPTVPSQPPAPPPTVHQPQQRQQIVRQQHRPQSKQVGGTEIVMAVPEQQVPPAHEMGGSNTEPTSSRWPKAEVLALIKIRSGLEHRYQEAGPKGPLWEEISAAMLRLCYKRSSKRCKEKWENINKYYKKVKESNKKRPEDAKTCPYFHELDALYCQKILGGGSSTSAAVNVGGVSAPLLANYPVQQQPGEEISQQQQQQSIQTGDQRDGQNVNNAGDRASKAGQPGTSLFEQGSAGSQAHKPEDLVRELMGQQHDHQHHHGEGQRPFSVDDLDRIEDAESENMEEDDEEEEDDESMEAYKIEFQRQKGGGNGPPSFLAMVQ